MPIPDEAPVMTITDPTAKKLVQIYRTLEFVALQMMRDRMIAHNQFFRILNLINLRVKRLTQTSLPANINFFKASTNIP